MLHATRPSLCVLRRAEEADARECRVDRKCIVPAHVTRHPQLTQLVDEVAGEAVIVVAQQQHPNGLPDFPEVGF